MIIIKELLTIKTKTMRYVIYDVDADEGQEYIGIDMSRTDDIDNAEHFASHTAAQIQIDQSGTSSMIVIDTYDE